MSFASPLWLLGLLGVPAALAAYLASRRRAKRYAVRFTAVPALKLAAWTVPAWRRHLPAALALAALAALVVSLAKPQKTVAVAVQRASIMLVTDQRVERFQRGAAILELGARVAAGCLDVGVSEHVGDQGEVAAVVAARTLCEPQGFVRRAP